MEHRRLEDDIVHSSVQKISKDESTDEIVTRVVHCRVSDDKDETGKIRIL